MKLDIQLATPCGEYCGNCLYYTKQRTPHCLGCDACKGHPFHGEYKVYFCAQEHKVAHCGECADFPCSLFVNQFDPEHGQTSAILRAGLLAYRQKAFTERTTSKTYLYGLRRFLREENLTPSNPIYHNCGW